MILPLLRRSVEEVPLRGAAENGSGKKNGHQKSYENASRKRKYHRYSHEKRNLLLEMKELATTSAPDPEMSSRVLTTGILFSVVIRKHATAP